MTAVSRRRPSGLARLCRRCPACVAVADACLVLVAGDVPNDEAPTLDINGMVARNGGSR
jgi:hypothetical protein